jgi:hypothetical protein
MLQRVQDLSGQPETFKVPSFTNGNGHAPVSGRGSLRRKLTPQQRVALAVDIATGAVPFAPSFKQTAAAVGTTPYRMRQERKARAQREAERRAAEARQRSQAEAEAVDAGAEILADTWRSVSPESREVAIRLLGPGAVWDAIARVIA